MLLKSPLSEGRQTGPQGTPHEVLILCDYHRDVAATLRDHVDAFSRFSKFRCHRLSMLGNIPESIELGRFDAVVIHYSLVACMDRYLSPSARARIAAFGGLKCLYIQDEYRFVDASIRAMKELGIHVLFTCVPEEEIDKVYPEDKLPGVRRVNVLTGYVPEHLLPNGIEGLRSIHERKIDVGYRGRSVPAWLGELGQEKWRIGMRFRDEAVPFNLKCDISFREEDRLYGDAWIEFLKNCKAVLGTESGSSVFDFSGEVQKAVDDDLARNPTLDFDTLQKRHFVHLEGRINLAQISPRCFECAALGTVMILYEGKYSGRLKPWRHYIPLRKDHSNMEDVVAILRDDEKLTEIARTTYQEVALVPENSFRHFVEISDAVMHEAFRPEMSRSQPAYRDREIERRAAMNFTAIRRRAHRKISILIYKLIFAGLLGHLKPEVRNVAQAKLRKIYRILTCRAGMAILRK